MPAISDLITPEDVASLGLVNLEFRYLGVSAPGTENEEAECDMWAVTVWADGFIDAGPHCDDSSATEAADDELEGIGGEYVTDGSHRHTFSYISDDKELAARFDVLLAAKNVS